MRGSARVLFLLSALALASCTSTEPPLDVGLAVAPQPQPAVASPAQIPIAPASTPAAAANGARLQFAPIVGATLQAATPLSRRLSARAAENGLSLVRPGDPETRYLVKGYFSALAERDETIVIYVWDVLDPAGNRLHRIQGQEKAPGGAADAWANVPDSAMEAIADRTIAELAAWIATRPR